jgi:4-hydroxyphenylpyruvate dioxygenase
MNESASKNPLGIRRVHHLELAVGNAKQAAYYYRKAFGFSQIAYRGLETGERDLTSYVMAQGQIRLVLSTPLSSAHPYNDYLRRHGDGVVDIALEVEDADQAFKDATARGATALSEPGSAEDAGGSARVAAIGTYGEVRHSLIAAGGYRGSFLPGYMAALEPEPDAGLLGVDHVVGNVEQGKMSAWADFYTEVMGFHRYITFDDKDISTEYSALQSVVMASHDYAVKFPINEPAVGKKKSQIQEYIEFNEAPGVQHMALLTRDIVATVRSLRGRGVEFLHVPAAYYAEALARVGAIDEAVDDLSPLGILIDRDDEGYLLQLFTRPIEDRPTLFIEVIQRKGARGFGKGNFRALFESIEREQERRGNL